MTTPEAVISVSSPSGGTTATKNVITTVVTKKASVKKAATKRSATKRVAPELFVTDNDTDAPAQTMMLEAPVLMPSPPQVSPAEDVIIESITTFLAVDERVPERAASKTGGGRAPEAAIASSAGASASAQSPTHEGDDDLLAKRAILHEWQNWSALNSDELSDRNVAAYFIRHLEARKPKLLDFAAEDKMQVVRTWLLSEHCIKA